jgi:hypothetical protein
MLVVSGVCQTESLKTNFKESSLKEYVNNDSIKFICFGEIHEAYAWNQDILIHTIGLSDSSQINTLLLEVSYSEGFILNDLLGSDNLEERYEYYKRTRGLHFLHHDDFLLRLRSCVEQRQVDDFQIVGIDIGDEIEFVVEAVKLVGKNNSLGSNHKLVQELERVTSNQYYNEEKKIFVRDCATALQDSFELYQKILGAESCFHLQRIFDSFLSADPDFNYSKLNIDLSADLKREEFIYSTIVGFDKISKGKRRYLASLGLFHIAEKTNHRWLGYEKWTSVIAMLCNDQRFSDHVLGIPILYDYRSLVNNRFHMRWSKMDIHMNRQELKELNSLSGCNWLSFYSVRAMTKGFRYVLVHKARHQ